ncbi:MAG: hypothetical protein H6645_00510 [Caldilineaceae bacterium]|nr:hypothetical protein [Caldilineaceae bacterium]
MFNDSNQASNHRSHLFVLFIAIYAIGIGAYFALRYAGGWMEIDTARMTNSARAVVVEGVITPSTDVYAHGFAYPVMVAWLAQMTGVSVLQLQTLYLPLISVLLPATAAYAVFRVFLRVESRALLALLILCLQPDFLFVTLRGSHEKITWTLMLAALFILHQSAARLRAPQTFIRYILIFYAIVFTQISTNSFFASTFITAITFGLLIGLVVKRWTQLDDADYSVQFLQRMGLVAAASLILVYIFLVHIYAPAEQLFQLVPEIVDRVALLVFGFEFQVNPSSYIAFGWLNLPTYLAVSGFTWLVLAISLGEWCRQALQFVRRERTLQLPHALPWLLYAGFAIQMVFAVMLDFAGTLSANLQLRILPGLLIFAVILTVQAVEALFRTTTTRPTLQRGLQVAMIGVFLWAVPASLLKITNEPLVSNKWVFYDHLEEEGLNWVYTHTTPTRNYFWAGLDERLIVVLAATLDAPESYFNLDTPGPDVRYYLLSETDRLRHARVERPLPAIQDENIVYDNGNAKVYHRKPQTPYQE